jgi:hypothetical protein
MPVMNIRKMSMLVLEWRMLVAMCMRLNAIPVEIMDVLVMRMMLGKVQPDTDGHQYRG